MLLPMGKDMFGKLFDEGRESETAERIIEREQRKYEPLRDLGSTFIHVTCQCQTQIWELFPNRSKPDVELFPRLQMEIDGFFLSMVDRAADFNHLTEEQRDSIFKSLVPTLVESSLDNFKPPLSDDLREDLRGQFLSNICQTVAKYCDFAGTRLFIQFVIGVKQIMETDPEADTVRKIASIAEEQVHEADFGKLVIAVKEAP